MQRTHGNEHQNNEKALDSDLEENTEIVQQITAKDEDKGLRLDVFLSCRMGLTRSFLQKLIKDGMVQCDSGKRLKASTKIQSGQTFQVTIPPAEDLEVIPEFVPFEVIYVDSHLVVVNKPAGVVVHPAPGNWHRTLVHGLLYRFPDIGIFNNVIRPGIVHRLDQTTSGLMIIARDQVSMENLQSQFKERTVTKKYLALACSTPQHKTGLIDLPIGRNPVNRKKMGVISSGRPSKTLYKTLWSYKGSSLLECTLLTGRTHQIRVHLESIGCPLAGDTLYGGRNIPFHEMGRVFLHSWKLGFIHPITGKKLVFTNPLPNDLIQCLRCILSRDQALSL